MSHEWFPSRTSKSIRNFETWFGAIFLAVGLAALGMGLLLFRLLDGDPDIGSGAWLALGIPTLVGVIFVGIGGYFFRSGLEKSQRETRLRQSGTVIEATVTAVEPTATMVNGRRLWHVRYTYEAHTGRAYNGDSGYLEAAEAQSYHHGQTVFVRYNPEQPSENSWVGRDQGEEWR